MSSSQSARASRINAPSHQIPFGIERLRILRYTADMSTVLAHPETDLAETNRHAFNLAVWDRLSADPVLVDLDYRIETDEHGQIIMSPPPAPSHGSKQGRISHLLRVFMQKGEVLCECPISTRKGVKAADVAWCSPEIWERTRSRSCFLEAPGICVEVISSSNTKSEIEEKKSIYFEEGAKEVWICHEDGRMEFFLGQDTAPVEHSNLVREFPGWIG